MEQLKDQLVVPRTLHEETMMSPADDLEARPLQGLVHADVQIYCMGVFEPVLFAGLTPAEVSGPGLLAEISEQTGGRVFAW